MSKATNASRNITNPIIIYVYNTLYDCLFSFKAGAAVETAVETDKVEATPSTTATTDAAGSDDENGVESGGDINGGIQIITDVPAAVLPEVIDEPGRTVSPEPNVEFEAPPDDVEIIHTEPTQPRRKKKKKARLMDVVEDNSVADDLAVLLDTSCQSDDPVSAPEIDDAFVQAYDR